MSNMSEEQKKQFFTQRMKERGMSDAEIKERLAQMAAGGGRPGGREVKAARAVATWFRMCWSIPATPTSRMNSL